MLVVSFFTEPYAEHAARLRASCERFGYRHWIAPVDCRGSWESNCARKAEFIRMALLASDEEVLWLDADAVIERRIEAALEFEEHVQDYDFAVFRDEARKSPKHHLRSGTLWFSGSESSLLLTDLWTDRCNAEPEAWDQEHLFHAWRCASSEYSLKTHFLPESYCKIFDRGHCEDPYIKHFQASRQLRNKQHA